MKETLNEVRNTSDIKRNIWRLIMHSRLKFPALLSGEDIDMGT